MAPNLKDDDSTINKDENEIKGKLTELPKREYKLIYWNILLFTYLHLSTVYGIYLLLFKSNNPWTLFLYYWFLIGMVSSIGITAGSHRLWAHRTYKAKLPLQILLMFLTTIAFQKSVYYWVRDHRTHHKYSDTDADPHNARRGFFYSHIGWIFARRHPSVIEKGKLISLQDLHDNPVVMFQKKYTLPLVFLLTFGLPTVIPCLWWGEPFYISYHCNMWRFIFSLHGTCLVNSAAHLWGTRPFDKEILPVQNLSVALLASGEGYHNYHHAFPQDYRAAELGSRLNFTKKFIDFFAWIGWAYDLKTVSDDVVKATALKLGDGTYVLKDENSY